VIEDFFLLSYHPFYHLSRLRVGIEGGQGHE
jgi:hypothetical protein